jgi:monoamine oxidase
MSAQPDHVVDVVVAGAGAAGLSAACELKRAGKRVLVLEARDRVGGRTLSETLPNGASVDLGGQWVGPSQKRVHRLIEEYGLSIFPTFRNGNSVLCMNGQRVVYDGALPPPTPEDGAELVRAFRLIDEIGSTIPIEAPWAAPNAAELDSKSLSSWARETLQGDFARNAIDALAITLFSSEARELSFLHFVTYIASAGGFEPITATAGGAQDSRFAEGFQSLSKALARELAAELVLSSPVTRISHDAEGVTVFSEKATVRAARAIVALPPLLAGRLVYDPPMPAARDQLTQRMPMGTAIKFIVLYERPFWRDDGLSGFAFSDLPVGLTYDNSPPDGSSGAIVGFIEGQPARVWGEKSPEQREAEALRSLELYFGAQARRHGGYLEKYWADDPWSRGCYAGIMPPGGWTGFGAALREPVARIHWAGTETATEWMGYVEGALQSGERAAREILQAG